MQADAAKLAEAAEKFAALVEGPLPREVLDKVTGLQSKGITVNVGVQWPAGCLASSSGLRGTAPETMRGGESDGRERGRRGKWFCV
eukprot:1210039-Rhodomonas_salina.3